MCQSHALAFFFQLPLFGAFFMSLSLSRVLNLVSKLSNISISFSVRAKACFHMGILYPRDIIDSMFEWFDDDGSGNLDHNELVRQPPRS